VCSQRRTWFDPDRRIRHLQHQGKDIRLRACHSSFGKTIPRVVCGASVCVVIFCAGCDGGLPTVSEALTEDARPGSALPVRTAAAVWREDVDETVVSFGQLIAARESVLRFSRGGRIGTVTVQSGDSVEEGTIVAQLQQDGLREQKGVIEQDLTRLRTELRNAPQVETLGLRQQIQQGESRLRAVEAELARGILTAPFTGIVADCAISAGDTVSPSLPVMRVVEDAPPLVAVHAAQEIAQLLTSETTVWVALGDRSRSTSVRSRSPLRGPVPGEKIVLEFAEAPPAEQWAWGDVVEARFVRATGDAGFEVALGALQHDATMDWFVFVAEPVGGLPGTICRIEQRSIQVIRTLDESALVLGELAVGERVVIEGTHRIVAGQQVRISGGLDSTADAAEVAP
jgi:multidrug efflux pump subunit AcrA (membrane-fusion protein)